MPCTARTEMWNGANYVTILSYTCEGCGRRWENGPDGIRSSYWVSIYWFVYHLDAIVFLVSATTALTEGSWTWSSFESMSSTIRALRTCSFPRRYSSYAHRSASSLSAAFTRMASVVFVC